MPIDREHQDRRRKAVVDILATTPAKKQIEIVRALRKLDAAVPPGDNGRAR